MHARRFEVTGRVQGVGFRAYAMRIASELEIAGEVWNRRDGGVEIIAYSSDPQAIQEFESRLRQGPGRVERVVGGLADASDPPTDFRASFTR